MEFVNNVLEFAVEVQLQVFQLRLICFLRKNSINFTQTLKCMSFMRSKLFPEIVKICLQSVYNFLVNIASSLHNLSWHIFHLLYYILNLSFNLFYFFFKCFHSLLKQLMILFSYKKVKTLFEPIKQLNQIINVIFIGSYIFKANF